MYILQVVREIFDISKSYNRSPLKNETSKTKQILATATSYLKTTSQNLLNENSWQFFWTLNNSNIVPFIVHFKPSTVVTVNISYQVKQDKWRTQGSAILGWLFKQVKNILLA